MFKFWQNLSKSRKYINVFVVKNVWNCQLSLLMFENVIQDNSKIVFTVN